MFSHAISIAFVVALQADTVVVIGMAERDLTGDGQPEVLKLVGNGRSVDSLDVTFSIESAGATVYRAQLAPMTRRVAQGFARSRRRLSRAQYREQRAEFGKWFFGPTKFKRPSEFLKDWGGPGRIARIPSVIARDRRFSTTVDSLVAIGRSPIEAERTAQSAVLRSVSVADSIRAVATWKEIQEKGRDSF